MKAWMELPGAFGGTYGGYDELLKLTVEFIPVKKKHGHEPGTIKGASGKETERAASVCLRQFKVLSPRL